jgi:TM2 domain-containing membrane protein YozV
MPHITHYLPELEDPERCFIAQLTAAMSEAQVLQFATAYRQARKDPQTILLMAVIGVVAVPGLHRFWLGQVGIGFLYFLTWGLLLIGTITDVVKHKDLAFRYNRQIASRIANNLVQSGKASLIGPELAAGRDRGLFARERHPA